MSPSPSSDDRALIEQRQQAITRQRRKSLGLLRSLGRSNRLFPRKLVVTRDGKWIIAMALLLGVGAVNTGNNLLYLVLSLLISIIAISGVLSEANLRDLKVARHHGRELEVGEVTMLRTEVLNAKSRAAFNIEVNELVEEGLVRRPGYVLHLRPGETGQAFTMVRPTRRGPILSEGMQVVTAYPFGFARKTRVLEESQRWWALPPVWPTTVDVAGAAERGFLAEVNQRGAGSELMGLRDWRAGDARRDVHWKISARRGRLITREWQAEANRAVMVEFVHLAPTDSDDPSQLDAACARVAGLCAGLLEQELAVGLCTADAVVPPAINDLGEQLLRVRRALAGHPADRAAALGPSKIASGSSRAVALGPSSKGSTPARASRGGLVTASAARIGSESVSHSARTSPCVDRLLTWLSSSSPTVRSPRCARSTRCSEASREL